MTWTDYFAWWHDARNIVGVATSFIYYWIGFGIGRYLALKEKA